MPNQDKMRICKKLRKIYHFSKFYYRDAWIVAELYKNIESRKELNEKEVKQVNCLLKSMKLTLKLW